MRLRPRTLECGGKRSATPLWIDQVEFNESNPKRRRRFVLSALSKERTFERSFKIA